MKITFMELKTDNLLLTERTKTIFSLLERGRKQGSDLVMLPLFTNIQEVEDLMADDNGFLRGTNDYPDMFLLLGAVDNKKDIFLLLSEGRVYARLLFDENADGSVRVGNIKNWNLILSLAPPKECSSQALVIYLNSSPKDLACLKSHNTAHLFLTTSVSRIPFLYYQGQKTDFSAIQQKAYSFCLE